MAVSGLGNTGAADAAVAAAADEWARRTGRLSRRSRRRGPGRFSRNARKQRRRRCAANAAAAVAAAALDAAVDADGPCSGFNQGPPEKIIEAGEVMHEVESQLLVRGSLEQLVPYFNGRIFLENKEEVGKVDEILGPINEMYFSVKLNEGIKASSVKPATRFFVDVNQTLPLSRFLPKPAISKTPGAGAKAGIDIVGAPPEEDVGEGAPVEAAGAEAGEVSEVQEGLEGLEEGDSLAGEDAGKQTLNPKPSSVAYVQRRSKAGYFGAVEVGEGEEQVSATATATRRATTAAAAVAAPAEAAANKSCLLGSFSSFSSKTQLQSHVLLYLE
ncbi:hypothetical protein Esti_005750 [Eimeria stiedai]